MKSPAGTLHGLYDPSYEHDACGVAFVARIGAPGSHEVISRALYALEQLEHRGAEGADPDTGDGAGILSRSRTLSCARRPASSCPTPGGYGVAHVLPPAGRRARAPRAVELIERTIEDEGQRVLGWRDVPVDDERLRRWRAERPPRTSPRSSWAPPWTAWPTATRSSASST